VINKYVQNIGVSLTNYEFVDIYGLDAELLQMVPRPVLAVLLLFPISQQYRDYVKKLEEHATKENQKVSPNLYFTRQIVRNACGTVALIHALSNNSKLLNIDTTKAFARFMENTKSLTPEERAERLRTDDDMTCAHKESASEGQTYAGSPDDDVDLHFIAFVEKDGDLYELDGAKDIPINHGPVSKDKLLEKTCEIAKKIMELNPTENRFNLIGFAAKEN